MKKIKGFSLLEIIIIIIVTAVISCLATGVIMLNNSSISSSSNIKYEKDKDLQGFIEVYEMLLDKYYDKNIDKKGMLSAAESAMVSYMGDKYTTYLNDSEYQEILDELSGYYVGIGVYIEDNKIVKVLKNSPAEKAGLLDNDIIVKINGNIIANMNGEEIKKIISNENDNSLDLEINRNNEIIKYSINKEKIIKPTVTTKIVENTKIGYMDIDKFTENLEEQVRLYLSDIENENIESLIIDLRDNVGGYLTAAEDVASMFLEKGKDIYGLESNNAKVIYSDKTDEKRTYPIVVLLNNGSASASEILAAALKDSYGATIVGTKSFGKGKVQQVASLNNGDSVKYTSAKWLTPKGVCIDGVGIYPDYDVVDDVNTEVDEQLERAIELLK